MKKTYHHLSLFFFMVWVMCACTSSSEQEYSGHPRIYVNDGKKDNFVTSVKEVSWKRAIIDKKKSNLEKYLAYVEEDSTWLLSRLQMNWNTKHTEVYLIGGDFDHSAGEAPVPTVRYSGTRDWATDYRTPSLEEVEPYQDDARGIYRQRKDNGAWEWIKPSLSGHSIEKINDHIMQIAADAAFLYWLTGEEKYAELATPVFFQYIEGMYYRDAPIVLDSSSQRNISGLATFEVIHERIVVSLVETYDFLYDYFQNHKMNLTHAQAVFQKWGDQIITYGVPDNNWNLFQARFLTYIAIVLEDDSQYENGKGRQYYLKNTFDISSPKQIALRESMRIYDQDNGIWPESPSYSMHVTTSLLEILTLLDNFTHENELKNFPIVEKAALAAFQYQFPNGYTLGFGDSGHHTLPADNFELLIANYHKYDELDKEKVISGLLYDLMDRGHYQRKGGGLFELFFYTDDLLSRSEIEKGESLVTPTFYAPNVSLFVQRQGQGQDAMMISTLGSYGNHAHANGIAMELYANNYVLGPDMGRGSSYWHPDFLEYYSQFPAHNTVVVDGVSTYASMRSYDPYTLEGSFPKSGEQAFFDKVSFVDVSFFEPKTEANQRRVTTMIETPAGQRYALDIFRSGKVNGGKEQHDYFYHNLGQSLDILDTKGQKITLTPTDELGEKHGELKAYDYFTDKKKAQTGLDLKARFTIQSDNKPDQFMDVWAKGYTGQQVFSVLGPKCNAITEGTAPSELLDAKIPTLMLRRQGSAWSDPFVAVFNPYIGVDSNQILDIQFDGNRLGAQQITVALIDGTRDVIHVGETVSSVIEKEGFYQKGLLSTVRAKEHADFDFVFLSGITRFENQEVKVITTGIPATVSLERDGRELKMQNDQPVVVSLRRTKDFDPKMIKIYRGDQEIDARQGIISSDSPDWVEFRLETSFEKIVVVE
ncbi:heparinase II/III-family protein [Reichenbachiella agarivorans]|uniref:Heparinase II/III-family protein n=1 Tax=Reichenbachiella agarivorans TaxID=2979464 RepID=A0ABY6CS16_9BACT|nr:heparinase II/III-family protein [Reichenbachiella agarivorans]UXP32639.1 heparinase II/III-family protein [Reichenbachiella agarivorans]